MAVTAGNVYSMAFYQTWIHTYLVKGRGFREDELWLSSVPYVFGAAANLLGGLACDWLARVAGVKWSRRGVGMAGALLGAISMAGAMFASSHLAVILVLSLAYAGFTLQQPAIFSACLDIGGLRGGAVAGFMNTAGQVGGAVASVVFGYLVKATGNYDAPLVPMAALLATGFVLWLKVDVNRKIEPG
jgi:ACS family glucarate transporter-like MFS transporter